MRNALFNVEHCAWLVRSCVHTDDDLIEQPGCSGCQIDMAQRDWVEATWIYRNRHSMRVLVSTGPIVLGVAILRSALICCCQWTRRSPRKSRSNCPHDTAMRSSRCPIRSCFKSWPVPKHNYRMRLYQWGTREFLQVSTIFGSAYGGSRMTKSYGSSFRRRNWAIGMQCTFDRLVNFVCSRFDRITAHAAFC